MPSWQLLVAAAPCLSPGLDALAAALASAVVAVLGTLAVKHRPAGARTRRSDRPLEPATQPARDWFDTFDDEDTYEAYPPEPPPRPGRLRRAARELRER